LNQTIDYQKMSYSYLVPEHLRGKQFATAVWTLCICDEHTRRQLEKAYETVTDDEASSSTSHVD
jgi:hypothetical protein